MFTYTNPITTEVEAHLKRLGETAVAVTISGPGGSVTLDLNHIDAEAIGRTPIGDVLNRELREAVDQVRAPFPQQVASR